MINRTWDKIIKDSIKDVSRERKSDVVKQAEGQLLISVEKALKSDRLDFERECLRLKKNADTARSFLFSPEMENLRINDHSLFVKKVSVYLFHLSFFPSEELKQKVLAIGVPKRCIRWFVGLKEIIKEFDKINSGGWLRILPSKALIVIEAHLFFKIGVSVYSALGKSKKIKSGKFHNEVHTELWEFTRRSNYGSKVKMNSLKKPFDRIMEEFITSSNDIVDIELTSNLLKLTQGKTENQILSKLAEMSIFSVRYDLSERNINSCLFDLYKLIMPDKELLSQVKFEEDKNAGYDRDYVRYQTETIKTILHRAKDQGL